jgi:hypothetical protein
MVAAMAMPCRRVAVVVLDQSQAAFEMATVAAVWKGWQIGRLVVFLAVQ